MRLSDKAVPNPSLLHDVAPVISRCGFRDKRKNGNAATSQASFRMKRQNIEEYEQYYE